MKTFIQKFYFSSYPKKGGVLFDFINSSKILIHSKSISKVFFLIKFS
jgi:hypothetical protein